MSEHKIQVNRQIIALAEQFGEAIPLSELYPMVELSSEEVDEAIDELVEEGIVNFIDGDTITLNR